MREVILLLNPRASRVAIESSRLRQGPPLPFSSVISHEMSLLRQQTSFVGSARAGQQTLAKQIAGVCGTLNSTAQASPQTKGYFRRVRESSVLCKRACIHRRTPCFQVAEIWKSSNYYNDSREKETRSSKRIRNRDSIKFVILFLTHVRYIFSCHILILLLNILTNRSFIFATSGNHGIAVPFGHFLRFDLSFSSIAAHTAADMCRCRCSLGHMLLPDT